MYKKKHVCYSAPIRAMLKLKQLKAATNKTKEAVQWYSTGVFADGCFLARNYRRANQLESTIVCTYLVKYNYCDGNPPTALVRMLSTPNFYQLRVPLLLHLDAIAMHPIKQITYTPCI